jgi:hypothetical protein
MDDNLRKHFRDGPFYKRAPKLSHPPDLLIGPRFESGFVSRASGVDPPRRYASFHLR